MSNQHGVALVEFLLESKMCILNGRINPQNDDFTCVSTKGRSVVDYVIVPQSFLKKYIDFRVTLTNDVIEREQLNNFLCNRCRVPDHSLLQTVIDIGVSRELHLHQKCKEQSIPKRKFDRKKIPSDFMSNENDRQTLLRLIESIEMCRKQQGEVDAVYDRLVGLLHDKMKEVDAQFGCTIKLKKRHRPALQAVLE